MRNSTKTIAITISLFIIITLSAKAQDGFLDLLYGTPEDATKYSNSYFAPVFKGLGYGFNNGWYNTAKTHEQWGFDITISANLAFVPEADEFFTFRNEDYKVMQLENNPYAPTPTIFGPNEPGPMFQIPYDTLGTTLVLAEFEGIEGAGLKDEIGFNAIPSPIIQVGIGVFKNTDIKVRYIPDVSSTDKFDYSVWGIGIMHDVGQWIPGMKESPIDISIFGAYSSLKSDIYFDMDSNFPGVNQKISTGIKGWTLEALVSKKISVLTIMAGLGYNSAKTNFDLLGTYDVTYNYLPVPITYTDPIKLKTNESSMRITGGLRVQLAIVTIFSTYTFNGYNLLNAGFGVSIK